MSDPTDSTAAATTALAAATLDSSASAAAPAPAPTAPFAFGSFTHSPASAPFSNPFGAASFGSPVAAPSFNFGAAAAVTPDAAFSSPSTSAQNPFAASSFAPRTDAAAAPFAFSAGSFSSSPTLTPPSRSSHGGKQRRSPAKPHPSSSSSAAAAGSSALTPAYVPDEFSFSNPRPAPQPTFTDINDALKSTAIRPTTNFAKKAQLAAEWAKNQMERTMDQTSAKKIAAEAEEAAAAAAIAAASGSPASAASSSSGAAVAPAAAVYSLLNVGHTDAWLAEREMWDQQDAKLSPDSSTAAEIRSLLNELDVASVLASIIVSFVEPPYSSFRSGFFPEDKYSLHAMPQMAVPAGATLVAAAVDILSTHLAQVQLCLRELKRADEHAYDVTMALEQARCDNHLHRERCSACAVSPIRGLCWRCEACPNFHLCNACCQAGAEPQHHLRSHPLIRLTGSAPVPTVVPVGAAAEPSATLVAAPVAPAVAAAPVAVVSLDASEGSAAVAAASSSKSSAPPLDAALLRAPPKTLLSELSVCWHHPSRGQFAASLSGWRSLHVFELAVSRPGLPFAWVTARSSLSERTAKARAEAEHALANPPIPPAVLKQHAAVYREATARNERRRRDLSLPSDYAPVDSPTFLAEVSAIESAWIDRNSHARGVTVRSAVIFYTRAPGGASIVSAAPAKARRLRRPRNRVPVEEEGDVTQDEVGTEEETGSDEER